MAEFLVQGETDEAVRFAVLSYLEQTDRRFRRVDRGFGKRIAERRRQKAAEVVDYALQYGRENAQKIARLSRLPYPTTDYRRSGTSSHRWADDLARDAMCEPDAPRGAILSVLIGWLSSALVKLILRLVLEWLLSQQSEGYRTAQWGTA